MQPSPIHIYLKEETKKYHDMLEAMSIPKKIYDMTITEEEYFDYLQVFYNIHKTIEAQMLLFDEDWKINNFAIQNYFRTELLRKDIALFSNDVADEKALYKNIVLEKMLSFDEAIGYLYVLTGSTMGGKILSTKIEANFLNTPFEKANNYFKAFDANTNAMWFAFLHFLDIYLQSADSYEERQKNILQGAIKCYKAVSRGFDAVGQ